jgi:hypothetical protein
MYIECGEQETEGNGEWVAVAEEEVQKWNARNFGIECFSLDRTGFVRLLYWTLYIVWESDTNNASQTELVSVIKHQEEMNPSD